MPSLPNTNVDFYFGEVTDTLPNWRDTPISPRAEAEAVEEILGFNPDELWPEDALNSSVIKELPIDHPFPSSSSQENLDPNWLNRQAHQFDSLEKDEGQPCEQGETASRSGCIPASGEYNTTESNTSEVINSYNKLGNIKDAISWATDNGAQVVHTNPKTASNAIASQVMKWVEDIRKQNRLDIGPPSIDEIETNWLKLFRSRKANKGNKPAFMGLNPELELEVQNSINANKVNVKFQEFVNRHGEVPVVFRREEIGNSAAAEYRGVIHVYDSPLWEGEVESELKPGNATAGGICGYSGVIRHEYAHGLFGKLTVDQQRDWRSLVSNVREEVEKGLTSYAGKNAEETFCELFAICTDRRYTKGVFPTWVDDLHEKQKEWLL